MIEAIIPVEHTLVDGTYTRIAYAVKGQVIVGCPHKKGGVAILLNGSIQQIDGDTKYTISAPKVFNTKADTQRAALALEDCTYMTVHSVKATTVEEAEKEVFEGVPQLTRIRNSFNSLLIEHNITEDDVNKEMESLPVTIEDSDKYYLGNSNIHGIGTFSKIEFKPGDVIAMSVLDGNRLATARYVNHSDIPNAKLVDYKENSVALVATEHIPIGYEILIDYKRRL